ncbi:hypothetical protein [Bradyrhizobium sp. USDA 4452]
MNNSERVLEFVSRFPGKDDDEIAAALKITPRQTVNIICRRLCENNAIRRERGPRGKLVNFATGRMTAVPNLTILAPKQSLGALSEDQVKAAIKSKLEADGWSVQVAWGRARGIDIVASRGNEKWIIECKGTGSLPPMQNNYFVGVIGELMQRMTDDRAKHSIAFPDVPKFRRLWSELPEMVKDRLKVTALFVSDNDEIIET